MSTYLVNSPSDSTLRCLRQRRPAVDSVTEYVRLVDHCVEAQVVHKERESQVDLPSSGDLLRQHEAKMLHAVAVVHGLALRENLMTKIIKTLFRFVTCDSRFSSNETDPRLIYVYLKHTKGHMHIKDVGSYFCTNYLHFESVQ